jgi:hypothetical protein
LTAEASALGWGLLLSCAGCSLSKNEPAGARPAGSLDERAAQAAQSRADLPRASAPDGTTPIASATAAVAPLVASAAAAASAHPIDPAGQTHDADAPRVYAKSRFVWIRPEPDGSKEWIGYLWTGGSVKLRHKKPVYGPGCMEWYAVEPRGFVCVDGMHATLDPNDATYRALLPYAPNLSSPWPHLYAESLGLDREPLELHSPPAFPAMALGVHEPHPHLPRRSTVAYSRELMFDAQPYLLSADFTWIPKASVKPYPEITFHGVKLGSEAKLPLAFFRGKDRPVYTRDDAGEFVQGDGTFPRLGFVELSGESALSGKDRYFRTRDGQRWLKQSDAVMPTPAVATPWGAAVGEPDTSGRAPKGRATWLEISVGQGTLIAYEDTTPVFTTLIAPGRGGGGLPDEDLIPHALTPLGTFPISGKFATATMEAPGEFIHSDVPWTQNFSGPYAVHAAYWHDDWGTLKSGGCVNVSPIDGRTLFEFTEPALPPGWHGVRWLPWLGASTLVVVHK